MEELGGGTDGGGGVVTKAFNGHDVIKTHVLNDKIIKSNQAITWKYIKLRLRRTNKIVYVILPGATVTSAVREKFPLLNVAEHSQSSTRTDSEAAMSKASSQTVALMAKLVFIGCKMLKSLNLRPRGLPPTANMLLTVALITVVVG